MGGLGFAAMLPLCATNEFAKNFEILSDLITDFKYLLVRVVCGATCFHVQLKTREKWTNYPGNWFSCQTDLSANTFANSVHFTKWTEHCAKFNFFQFLGCDAMQLNFKVNPIPPFKFHEWWLSVWFSCKARYSNVRNYSFAFHRSKKVLSLVVLVISKRFITACKANW